MPLYELSREGRFREASGETIMRELQVMLASLEIADAWFLSDHISNYVPIYGHLPEDRMKMLATVEMALEDPVGYLGPRHLTHL
jgi:hypothetical protein